MYKRRPSPIGINNSFLNIWKKSPSKYQLVNIQVNYNVLLLGNIILPTEQFIIIPIPNLCSTVFRWGIDLEYNCEVIHLIIDLSWYFLTWKGHSMQVDLRRTKYTFRQILYLPGSLRHESWPRIHVFVDQYYSHFVFNNKDNYV